MSTPPTSNGPLADYPGYFSGKLPLWKRRWVAATTAGIAGLVIGASGSTGSQADSVPAGYVRESVVDARVADQLDEAVAEEADSQVDEAVSDAVADAETSAANALAQFKAAARKAQKRAVTSAVSRAVAKERKKSAAAIADAKASARSFASSSAPAKAASSGSTDPQYSYCYEANADGYGNYQEGVDPEYDWYDDRDGDGMVCEF